VCSAVGSAQLTFALSDLAMVIALLPASTAAPLAGRAAGSMSLFCFVVFCCLLFC